MMVSKFTRDVTMPLAVGGICAMIVIRMELYKSDLYHALFVLGIVYGVGRVALAAVGWIPGKHRREKDA